MLDSILIYTTLAVWLTIAAVILRHRKPKQSSTEVRRERLEEQVFSMKDVSPLDACDVLYNHHYKSLFLRKLQGEDYSLHLKDILILTNIKHRLLREELEGNSKAFPSVVPMQP